MRRLLLAVLSALSIAGNLMPASAEAIQDRYCLQGRRSGYPGNCAFSTYAQCMATASGTADGCGVNPQYLFPRQRAKANRH
ncbi:MAG: DUF3551 domain-containing protein [Bradyrhizobium sp.]